jgi:hypothetical protein
MLAKRQTYRSVQMCLKKFGLFLLANSMFNLGSVGHYVTLAVYNIDISKN